MTEGFVYIQWKGTDACLDVHCRCGGNYHVDRDFVYFVHCPRCDKTFMLGDTVTLTEVEPDPEHVLTTVELEEDEQWA